MFEKVAYSYIALYNSTYFILENKLYKEILSMDNQQPSSKIEWRIVQEYDHYEVNELGQIRHRDRKILTPRANPGGYQYVNFKINGKGHNFAVNRIVANAFIPNPNHYLEVNHINGDKTDNRVVNLEWVTSSANKKHSHESGLRQSNGKKVEQLTLSGELLNTFDSVSAAAKYIGCSVGAISNCCNGRTKTSQGYKWRFAEGSTTKYSRKPSESVRDSLDNTKDEDIVSTLSES